MKRIVFVCLGNIVRSPLAENLFRKMAEERGMEAEFQVDSAGTSAYHAGEAPDARMRKVASRHGLDYTGTSRQFQAEDFDRFDLVIAMDEDNQRALRGMAAPEDEGKIYLMRDFDPQAGGEKGVPDPYYGGMRGFEKVFEILRRSTEGLLDALEENGGL